MVKRRSICEKFERALPFLCVDEEMLPKMMGEPINERIITGIVIPFFSKRKENIKHIQNCERCSDFYNDFLVMQRAETGKSIYELDQEYLSLNSSD